MKVFRHLEEVPGDYGRTVLSVGNFDGVHRAHQAVLANMVERAQELEARAMAVSFEPHPTRILRPDAPLKLITPTAVKLELLARTGIDALLLLPFSRDLSLMPAREFVERVLVDGLRAQEVHVGFNFQFGHRAEGDIGLLEELGRELRFAVKTHPPLRVFGKGVSGEVVSSSRIRELLREGRVGRARHLLGRPFSIVHTPGRGRGYGHKYTVPTINLNPYDEAAPQDGVYITETRVGAECFESVTNVGNRPTFGEGSSPSRPTC
jgi:riboflavin kinase/FMN adenylyltransferase